MDKAGAIQERSKKALEELMNASTGISCYDYLMYTCTIINKQRVKMYVPTHTIHAIMQSQKYACFTQFHLILLMFKSGTTMKCTFTVGLHYMSCT